LSELPIVGRLFTNRNDNNNKTEIVLLITPRIVRNIVRPNAEMAEFASSADSRLGGGAGVAQPFAGAPLPPPAASPAKPPVTTPGAPPPPPQFIPFTPPGAQATPLPIPGTTPGMPGTLSR
jgi:general secretion pathway protein D